jgi:hypothetical protein
MTRLFLSMVCLAFAGSLLLVSCEPPAENKTVPPKLPDATKPPEKPTPPPVPSTPPAPAPKTGALNIPGADAGIAAVNATAKDAAAITTCALTGCTSPGKPAFALVKDGKPLMFCCADCESKYKKANNIQ